jgi:hypothetical protein
MTPWRALFNRLFAGALVCMLAGGCATGVEAARPSIRCNDCSRTDVMVEEALGVDARWAGSCTSALDQLMTKSGNPSTFAESTSTRPVWVRSRSR